MNIPSKRITIFTLFFTGILMAANVIMSASFATSGEKLRLLEEEKATLTRDNQDLRRLILQDQSLQSLKKKATTLGFDKPTDQITISAQEQPVALR